MWLGFPSNAAEKKTNVVFPLWQEYQRQVEYLKKNKDKIQTKCFSTLIEFCFQTSEKLVRIVIFFTRRDMILWITLLKIISYPYLCAFVLPMCGHKFVSQPSFPIDYRACNCGPGWELTSWSSCLSNHTALPSLLTFCICNFHQLNIWLMLVPNDMVLLYLAFRLENLVILRLLL